MVDGFTSAEVGMFNGEPIISYKANRPSKRLDTKALARDRPDIVARYTFEVSGARTMRVVGDVDATVTSEPEPF